MKKKDIVEGKIIDMAFPNVGILETEGGIVRVKNALPGEVLRVQINKAKRGRYEGRVLEVLSESPLEMSDKSFSATEPKVCPHFRICGGCLFASIPYEEEIKIKEKQILDLIRPVVGEDVLNKIYDGITPSPRESEYRNKMEFSFGDEYKGGPLALGMHKRGAFYDIVTVRECRLIDSDFRNILLATLSYFADAGVSHYNRNTNEGYLRHLLVRKAANTGEILLSLVTASGTNETFDLSGGNSLLGGWKDALLSLSLKGSIVGILHTLNDRIADVVEDGGTEILYGKDYFTESLLSLSFKISPFSFFQTNSEGAELLYEKINSLVPKSGTVYDLYSGTGTIAQILSKKANQVVGVEIVEEAVIAARENAHINEIKNVEFLCGDVLKVLDEIKNPPEMIVLDPPREGVHPKALTKILSYGVNQILYVSCKPTSLARDIPAFMEAGYSINHLSLVDMFPRTGNCEAIAGFIKA